MKVVIGVDENKERGIKYLGWHNRLTGSATMVVEVMRSQTVLIARFILLIIKKSLLFCKD